MPGMKRVPDAGLSRKPARAGRRPSPGGEATPPAREVPLPGGTMVYRMSRTDFDVRCDEDFWKRGDYDARRGLAEVVETPLLGHEWRGVEVTALVLAVCGARVRGTGALRIEWRGSILEPDASFYFAPHLGAATETTRIAGRNSDTARRRWWWRSTGAPVRRARRRSAGTTSTWESVRFGPGGRRRAPRSTGARKADRRGRRRRRWSCRASFAGTWPCSGRTMRRKRPFAVGRRSRVGYGVGAARAARRRRPSKSRSHFLHRGGEPGAPPPRRAAARARRGREGRYSMA